MRRATVEGPFTLPIQNGLRCPNTRSYNHRGFIPLENYMNFCFARAAAQAQRVAPILAAVSLISFSAIAVADEAKGKKLYEERCVTCHGATGMGDGPVAMALPPEMKPRNLQDAAFKIATDDEKMKQVIKQGGAAFGLNALMPAQADLSDADLASVVAFVRSLKKK